MKAIEFNSGKIPNWCPGCGNFAIWNAIKGALAELNISGADVVNISGIGCSGKMLNYLKTYGFHTLHGRTMPVACGVKLANHKLTVLVNGGDGDGYGMGLSHFIHTIRRNIDITYLVHDNHVYGLTTGQASPTTDIGISTKSTPRGVIEEPLNPLVLSLNAGVSFLARGYSGDIEHLKWVIKEAIQHKGFSHVDILQPCVTFGKNYSYEYYDARVYRLDESHDNGNFQKAFDICRDTAKLGIGIIYKEIKPTYESRLAQLKDNILINKFKGNRDLEKIYRSMT